MMTSTLSRFNFSLSILSLTLLLLHGTFALKSPTRKPEVPISRFKSLDRILNRLDGISSSSPKISESGTSSYRNRLRELTSTVRLESRKVIDPDEVDDDEDSYEELEDDSQVLADTSNWNYSYKSGGSSRLHYGTSGRRFTSRRLTTTSTTTPPPPLLSYSQMKWRDLGTRQAVEQTRMRHSAGNSGHHRARIHSVRNSGQGPRTYYPQPHTPDTSIREAINHALKVSREGSCKTPRPRLVRVQDFYPHPGKTYVPHCTILHQCSDDTGCCRHDVLTCSPKTTQRVELYFYSILPENNRASSVERLVFYNHTECECRDKMEDMMPRDVPVLPSGTSFSNSVSGPPLRTLLTFSRADKNLNGLQCKCPSMFTERVLSDGACTCDCFDKQRECLLLKRGTDFFSMRDKWCIQSGRCEIPGCSYGSYIHLVGRCPRKKERSGQSLSWHRYLTQ